MAHKRTDIRNALVALLTNATDAGPRVYANRTYNLPTGKLPAIKIYDESEAAQPRDASGRTYLRTVSTRIEIQIEATTNFDSQLDEIAKQVEDLISSDRSIGGTALGSTYISTELTFDSSGQKPIGSATLNFEFKYIE